jgi:hypothetical protein
MNLVDRSVHPISSPCARHSKRGFAGAGAVLVLFVVACGTEPAEAVPGVTTAAITNANNYTSATKLTLPTYPVLAGSDITVCWDKMTTDLRCRSDFQVDKAAFLRVPGQTQAQVQPQLEIGNLPSEDVDPYFSVDAPASKCTTFGAMKSLGGTPFNAATDLVETTTATYLISVNQGIDPGFGARSLGYVVPSAGATATTINIPADSCAGILDFQASFSATPVNVTAAGSSWPVSWQGVTLDSQGQPVGVGKVTKLQLGFYENKSVAQVGADILHLETTASLLFEKAINGQSSSDLAMATEKTSQMTFAAAGGFANGKTGTWVLALSSAKSQNPAPLVLTVLNPI